MLQPHKRTCSICRSQPASFDDDACPQCAKALYADEDELRCHRDEDKWLDDPRHDQCIGGKFKE